MDVVYSGDLNTSPVFKLPNLSDPLMKHNLAVIQIPDHKMSKISYYHSDAIQKPNLKTGFLTFLFAFLNGKTYTLQVTVL